MLNPLLLLAQEDVAHPMPAAPWVASGLFGAVLAWLLFVHLPAKDKQIRELLEDARKEREVERQARQSMMDAFAVEANRGREALERRYLWAEGAIKAQTEELQGAIDELRFAVLGRPRKES